MLRPLAIASIVYLGAILGTGCATAKDTATPQPPRKPNVEVRSPHGDVLATGAMTLPDPMPAQGGFSGTCAWTVKDKRFPENAVSKSGQYQAQMIDSGKRVMINLNPGVADNNLNLGGERVGDQFRGECDISTFIGPRPVGTFVLHLR